MTSGVARQSLPSPAAAARHRPKSSNHKAISTDFDEAIHGNPDWLHVALGVLIEGGVNPFLLGLHSQREPGSWSERHPDARAEAQDVNPEKELLDEHRNKLSQSYRVLLKKAIMRATNDAFTALHTSSSVRLASGSFRSASIDIDLFMDALFH
jgi:hypothetical protein